MRPIEIRKSLFCISVHWDNRDQSLDDYAGIEETAKELQELSASGFEIGLSGIKTQQLTKMHQPVSQRFVDSGQGKPSDAPGPG